MITYVNQATISEFMKVMELNFRFVSLLEEIPYDHTAGSEVKSLNYTRARVSWRRSSTALFNQEALVWRNLVAPAVVSAYGIHGKEGSAELLAYAPLPRREMLRSDKRDSSVTHRLPSKKLVVRIG